VDGKARPAASVFEDGEKLENEAHEKIQKGENRKLTWKVRRRGHHDDEEVLLNLQNLRLNILNGTTGRGNS